MNTLINTICKNEGFTTVKAFRSFFEYYIIGWGELDNDFSYGTKRLSKNKTTAQWKKWYEEITDEEIESSLATKEEEKKANEEFKIRIAADKIEENAKTEEEKKAENETELQMRNAGLEYDINKTWEENIEEYAENPKVKKEEIKKYSGYGYHGGGRKPTGIKRVSINISGQPEQIERLKELATEEKMSVSKFILEKTGVTKKEI